MIGRGWGISWCRSIRFGLRIDWDTLIGNISNISVVMISGILDMLGSAIRKSNRVFSNNSAISISSLSSIKGSLRVIISYSIGIRVGFRGLLLLVVGSWGVVGSRGRGVIGSRGGGVCWGGGICWSGSVCWSMVDRRMGVGMGVVSTIRAGTSQTNQS